MGSKSHSTNTSRFSTFKLQMLFHPTTNSYGVTYSTFQPQQQLPHIRQVRPSAAIAIIDPSAGKTVYPTKVDKKPSDLHPSKKSSISDCSSSTNRVEESLSNRITSVVTDVRGMEKKLENAKKIKSKLDSFTNSKPYRRIEDFENDETEVKMKEEKISASKRIEEKISELHEQMKRLQSSPELLPPETIEKLKKETEERKIKMKRESEIQKEIDCLKKDANYLDEDEQKSITESLKRARQLMLSLQENDEIGSIQDEFASMLTVQEKVKRDLECSICLEIPAKNENVFSCNSSHLLCNTCRQRQLASCPVCKQNFNKMPPMRNLLAEKMITNLD